jgi:hypothetical protein
VRKASFNFDIGRFFKHANLSGINPILPSKTGGVLRTIGSASKHLQRDAPGWCIIDLAAGFPNPARGLSGNQTKGVMATR